MNIVGRTGEKVSTAGTYQNRYGKQICLKENDIFPACPVKGNPIEWEKVK